MEAVVLVIHLIVALAIIAVVLLQPSESGGFMGSSGSMSNLMAPRRRGDALSRLTAILGGAFFITSLTLAILAGQRGTASRSSILDVQVDAPVAGKAADAPAAKAEEPKRPENNKPANNKPSAPISR